MAIHRFSIATRARVEMVDITRTISEAVIHSGVMEGICLVYVPHTTAGVMINENADPDVTADIVRELNQVIPFEDHYRHGEGNSAAHIKSSLIGPSVTIPIQAGRLLLGTWQAIYFGEFDGPRTRTFFAKVMVG